MANYSKMTKAELIEKSLELGLDVDDSYTVADIHELLNEAFGDVELPGLASESPVESAPDKKATGKKTDVKKTDDPRKSWPVIRVSPDSADKRDVVVIVNGKTYLIKRGVDVAVPPGVLEALDHAVQTIYPDKDTMVPVEQHTYPYTVVVAGK